MTFDLALKRKRILEFWQGIAGGRSLSSSTT